MTDATNPYAWTPLPSTASKSLLIDNQHYFSTRDAIYGYPDDGHRFTFFTRAALEIPRVLDWQPDMIHCHDWHTGLIPNWLRTTHRHLPEFADTASVFTIHNLEYQGHFDPSVLEVAGLALDGLIPHPTRADLSDVLIFMSRGILFADKVSTVSPRYAGEILTPAYGHDLDPLLRDRESDLHGILNGIDTETANPATDPHLPSHYTLDSLERRTPNKRPSPCWACRPSQRARPPCPTCSTASWSCSASPCCAKWGIRLVTRLAEHKGLDLLLASLPTPHAASGPRRAAGRARQSCGEPRYEEALREVAFAHPHQDKGPPPFAFDNQLARLARFRWLIYAGSDIFLMPSRHEPCGLGATHRHALRQRAEFVFVVRATGGLADTVDDFDILCLRQRHGRRVRVLIATTPLTSTAPSPVCPGGLPIPRSGRLDADHAARHGPRLILGRLVAAAYERL